MCWACPPQAPPRSGCATLPVSWALSLSVYSCGSCHLPLPSIPAQHGPPPASPAAAPHPALLLRCPHPGRLPGGGQRQCHRTYHPDSGKCCRCAHSWRGRCPQVSGLVLMGTPLPASLSCDCAPNATLTMPHVDQASPFCMPPIIANMLPVDQVAHHRMPLLFVSMPLQHAPCRSLCPP